MTINTLIVDDDEGLRASLERSFRNRGHLVHGAGTVEEGCRLIEKHRIDLLLLDIRLPDGSGLNVLETARSSDEELVVIVLTAFPEVKTAVRAMRAGASDFVVKPFELDELHMSVDRSLEARQLRRTVRLLRRERQEEGPKTELIGESPGMRHVRDQIPLVAPTDTPVLVLGETGTGKEVVVDLLHRLSARAEGPLVKVNCSAFAEQLLESELFGHEKGAFTDARQARAGLFEMADGGTLFLDEIAELKPSLQAKLLRVVEGQPFRRLGGSKEIHTDVRIVAATHRDLAARSDRGEFRRDLFFRLNVFPIHVPPLREREDDAVLLARIFLDRSAKALRKGDLRLTDEAERVLGRHSWPGNVREIQNVMERAAILAEDTVVDVDCLPAELRGSSFLRRRAGTDPNGMPPLRELERLYILHVVDAVGGNISKSARVLGIARNTLKARIAETTEDH